MRRKRLRVTSIFLASDDFLLAVEQGDLAHLGQVHPDGVVDVPAVAVGVLVTGGIGVGDEHLFHERGNAFLPLLGLIGVDDADAVLVEEFEDVLEAVRIGRSFREGGIEVVVSERPGFLSLLDEVLENLVVLPVHPWPSHAGHPRRGRLAVGPGG